MPETPEQLYQRVSRSLRMPPVEDWDTFPFEGDMRPRALQAPTAHEKPRTGAGGTDCPNCAAPNTDYLWTQERWRLRATPEPTGLPLIVLLEPRDHYAEPGDLPDEMAAELGLLQARIERAIRRGVDEIGRVHVCRWGDGSEHLHWWFIARPARLPQLKGSFATIWDDILPPVPDEIWRDNLARLRRELDG